MYCVLETALFFPRRWRREATFFRVGLYFLSKNFAGYGAPHLEFQFDSKYPGKG